MRLYLLIFPREEKQRTLFPVAQVLDMADVECMIASKVNVDNSSNDVSDAAIEQRIDMALCGLAVPKPPATQTA